MGDSQLPPTDYFTGITFNPDFYQSTSDDYLTASTGKSYFLTYPISQGGEIFASNITIKSTLTDTSGDVGTAGQVLSSTGTGTNWITSSSGATYVTYTSSATLSTSINPILIVVFSGSTAAQVLTIPYPAYSVGQILQFKSSATVDVTISSGLVLCLPYSGSISTTIILKTSDVLNLIYTGSNWIQYTPSSSFTTLTASGSITSTAGNLIGIYKNISTSETASITLAGVITGTSLSVGTGAITCGSIVSSTDATTLLLGSNIKTANIEIGGALTSGDIIIGNNNSSGATITIGKTLTETTVNGILNAMYNNDLIGVTSSVTLPLAGKLRTIVVSTVSTSYTIPVALSMDVYIIILAGASGSILLPTTLTIGQKITFRSGTSNVITINSQSNFMIPPNLNTPSSTQTLAALDTVSYYCYSTSPIIWISV